MKRIGLIVAVEIEALKKKYGNPTETINIRSRTILKYKANAYELYALLSGAGEIAAAAATQLLISEFNVEIILNFGVVGGLSEEISRHRVCVVRDIVHYDFDTSSVDNCEIGRHLEYASVFIPTDKALRDHAQKISPDLVPVTCASGNKFVVDPEEKNSIHQQFQADIIEMEAAGILLTCNQNVVPCLMIKMVADGITGGAEEFSKEFTRSSEMCLEVLDVIVSEL